MREKERNGAKEEWIGDVTENERDGSKKRERCYRFEWKYCLTLMFIFRVRTYCNDDRNRIT